MEIFWVPQLDPYSFYIVFFIISFEIYNFLMGLNIGISHRVWKHRRAVENWLNIGISYRVWKHARATKSSQKLAREADLSIETCISREAPSISEYQRACQSNAAPRIQINLSLRDSGVLWCSDCSVVLWDSLAFFSVLWLNHGDNHLFPDATDILI